MTGRDGQGNYWLGNAQVYRNCTVFVETDGRWVYAKTGERLDSPAQIMQVLSRDCMTRGASVATDPVAKEQSLQDIRGFWAGPCSNLSSRRRKLKLPRKVKNPKNPWWIPWPSSAVNPFPP